MTNLGGFPYENRRVFQRFGMLMALLRPMLSSLSKYILALALVTASCANYAQAEEKPVDPRIKIWTQTICETRPIGACWAAHGWAWLHTADVVIEPGAVMVGGGAVTWTLGAVLVNSVTETPFTTYILEVGRTSVKVGTAMVITGAAIAVVGTVFSVTSFWLAGTTSTAAREEDEPMTRECIEMLAPFKNPGGVERFKNLSLEEFAKILPCLPKDKGMSSFAQGLGKKSLELENQIHAN